MKNLFLLSFIFLLVSCNTEYYEEEISPESFEKDGLSLAPSPSLGNVFVGIVNEGACSSQRYDYSIYASTSKTHTQDRAVHAAVVKDGEFIEAKVLIIPAGQQVSNNVAAFAFASRSYNSVLSKAFNVLIDGEIVDGYNFPSTYYNVQNCYTSSLGPNGCGSAIYEADDPTTAENEGPGDQDFDGICNAEDTDDNGNHIPDEWEN